MITRILVVDDHEIFAEGLCALLDKEPEFEVIGQARAGGHAVKLTREEQPDIVIMDMSMPDISGIEATRLIKAERPEAKILCLSMHSDQGFVLGALNAGASGYVLKDGAKKELLHAIRTVMEDAVYLSPDVTGLVVDAATSGSLSAAIAVLTERERDVLQRLAQGATTKEIANHFNLSVKTIGTHRAHIMDKLDIHGIAALTKFAIREGLTTEED